MKRSPLDKLTRGPARTGNVQADAARLLRDNGYTNTALHCNAVAAQAAYLAAQFGADPERAQAAGWLHDVSAMIPPPQRLAVARQWNLDVLPAEEKAPMLLHQKLSAVIARDFFGIQDDSVLSAIGCHTTLKAQASLLDKVVFVADKVAWDQPGQPPYQHRLAHALTRSLDHGVFCYLNHLWQQRATLAAVHPWFVSAYQEILASIET
jgi:predicted HD superfamily hydrolase involved in NAD metabolism